MKTVIVTGAAGFLGSHLSKHHLDAGDWVLGVDDFSSSEPNSAHLNELKAYETFQFVDASVCDDYKTWMPELKRSIDLVYNFACPASPPIYQAMPVHTMMTCVVGTGNMLELASLHGAILVHASTSEVYGDPAFTPQPESYRGCVNSYGPRSCYDEGKRSAEALCYDFKNAHGVDARLVRIFNTYGPNMDPHDGRVVSNFICQALRGEKMTVYGEGEQGRSFCYVDDLIRGIVALGALDANPCTPINLGNPHEITVMQLARRVIGQVYGGNEFSLRAETMVDHKPFPVDDPLQRCPDITLARRLLDWEPRVSLDEGLAKAVEYFRGVIKR